MISKKYKNALERKNIDDEMTAQGYSMVSDTFDLGTTKAGTMVYDIKPSPLPLKDYPELYQQASTAASKVDIIAEFLGLK